MLSEDQAKLNDLISVVYDELHRLATKRMASERPGHTLQATALVNEALLRLSKDQGRNKLLEQKEYFFAAAAEAMKRILIESARKKKRLKHGGGLNRRDLEECLVVVPEPSDFFAEYELCVEDLSSAIDRLEEQHPREGRLVKLRFFAGLSLANIATILDISPRSADRSWAFARAWLLDHLQNPRR